jgi:hypothetical protein
MFNTQLTSKRSVASVAFQENNKSWTWNVAKIAGSRSFTLTMQSASLIPDDIEVVDAEVPDPDEPLQITCGYYLSDLWEPIPQAPLGLQPLYDSLPTWLGGYRRDEAGRALTEMLRALKTATESALDAEIDEVYISTPLPVQEGFHARLRAASSALGLKRSSVAFWAPETLSKSTSTDCLCDDQPSEAPGVKELVLVLDHSHATLTATLGAHTECLLDVHRILRSGKLGAWGLRNLSWWEYDSKAEKELLLRRRHSMLVDSLRRMTALPLKGDVPGEENLAAVDRIILLGETADDEKLHNALEEVFGRRLGSLLANGRWDNSTRKYDPLYAAAEHVARCSLGSKRLRHERMEL